MSKLRPLIRCIIPAVLVAAGAGAAAAPAVAAPAPTCGNPVVVDFSTGYDPTAAFAPAGQNGWRAPDTSKDFGLSGNALRFSNAVKDGIMEQLFSPNVPVPASETGPCTTLTGSFTIASETGAFQDGLAVAVSLDNGTATRFGGTLLFHHVNGNLQIETYWLPTDAVSANNTTDWRSAVLATVPADQPHAITMTATLVPGPRNDVLTVTVDGTTVLDAVETWETYTEVAGGTAPELNSLLFRAAGSVASVDGIGYTPIPAAPALMGHGFLFSNLALNPVAAPTPTPTATTTATPTATTTSDPATPAPTSTTATGGGAELAATGAPTGALVLVASILLLGGGTLVLISRRKNA
jgi:LPXTG-motif cell wall-anchored protein